MDFINFPEANTQRTAPKELEDSVGTLAVYSDGEQCISCWQPTPAERDAIAAGLPVWLGCLTGHSQPPVWVSALKPAMPAVVHEPNEKMLQALEYFAGLLPLPDAAAKGLRTVPEILAEYPGLRLPNGQPFDPEASVYPVGDASRLEHYAALIEAYRQAGQAGVVAYLQPYEAFLPKEFFTHPAQ